MKENKSNHKSRREFLKLGALATAGSFFIVPRHVLGRGFIAPSDKLNIAGIGVAGKGFSDVNNAFNDGKNNIVALCDVDWGLAQEQFAKHPKAKKYKDYRVMLEEQGKDIDAITISTADHTHAVAALAAMQMGKHIYLQKPLTHNIYEARLLTEAARKHKVVTQMGNQGASNPDQVQMMKWFDEGVIGDVHTVHVWTNRPVWPQGIPVPEPVGKVPDKLDWDLWIGPASKVGYTPAYHPFKWRGWWNFGTGALGDMGCHLIDPPFRVLGLGYPTEVEASIGSVFLRDWTPEYIPEGCPPSSHAQLKFPATAKNKSEVVMTWSDGGIRPFRPDVIPPDAELSEPDGANGVFMVGTKGVMTCGVYGVNPKVFLNNGEVLTHRKEEIAAPEFGHNLAWQEACKEGFGKEKHKALTSSFDYAGPLTETVLMGNLAIRSYMLREPAAKGNGFVYPGRRKLLWDGENTKVTNFEPANQFVTREYKNGYSFG